jgi:hypothetical protein
MSAETIDGGAPYPFDSIREELMLGKPADATEALLAERGQQWGDAVTTHIRIAQIWSAILDTEVTAHQVALCMTGLKLVRASVNPDNPDSLDDAAGYVRIGQRIQGR